MKTLVESLFDNDLAEKEYEIDPRSIAYEWEYMWATAYNLTDTEKIYKIFDKQYLKKCRGTKQQFQEYLDNSNSGMFIDHSRRLKQYNMARVIGTWSNKLIPNGSKVLVATPIQDSELIYGIKKEVEKDVYIKFEIRDGGLTVDVNAEFDNKQINILFSFKHK